LLSLRTLGLIGLSASTISCTSDCAIGRAHDAIASFYDEDDVSISIDRIEWTFLDEQGMFACSEGESCTAVPLTLKTRDQSGTLTLVVQADGFETTTTDVWIESDGCHPVGETQIPVVLERVDDGSMTTG